jgi:hypothetical protein
MALAAGGRESVEVRDMAVAATGQMTGYVNMEVRSRHFILVIGLTLLTRFSRLTPNSHVTRSLSTLNPPPRFSSFCSPGDCQGVSREGYFAL